MRLHRIIRLSFIALTLGSAAQVTAQGGLVLLAGAGAVYNHRNGKIDDTQRHATASLQFRAPLSPIGVRADVMWSERVNGTDRFSANVNGLLDPQLPFISPYLIGGWGRYGIGEVTVREGYNVGGGVRLALGGLSVFGEVRRHWALRRDLATVGFSLN